MLGGTYAAYFPTLQILHWRHIVLPCRPNDISGRSDDRKWNMRRQALVPVSLCIEEAEKTFPVAETHKQKVIRIRNRCKLPESADKLCGRRIIRMSMLTNYLG